MFGKTKELQTLVLSVEGMMCAHCAAHVEKAVLSVRGVKEAKVDLAQATVTVSAQKSVTAEALAAAITAAGYRVK